MKTKKQVNNYLIKWSALYQKWHVKKGKIVFEEFALKRKAINWAKTN